MASGLGAGLAGGLKSGIDLGLDIKQQKTLRDLYKQRTEQSATEQQWKQEDRDRAAKEAGSFDDFIGASNQLMFRTDGSGQQMIVAPKQQSIIMDPGFKRIPGFARGGLVSLKPRGFAAGGVIPDAVFSGNAASAYNAPGLSTIAREPQVAPAQQQQEDDGLTPRQRFAKGLMTTDILTNPDKLSQLSALAAAHGVSKQIDPFLERAYNAKKTGLIDGAMQLMRGQVDEAIDNLARGGVKLEGRPVQVDPKNPRLWRINISGSGEREMDIGDLLQTTLEPGEFVKHDLNKNESQGKRNVSDATVRAHDSNVRVDNARIGKLGEETKNVILERSPGGLGGGSGGKLPSDAQMVEYLVSKGIVGSPKEAWQQVKTNGDKSPGAWRMSLIEANVKAGMPIAESAKDVDAFLAQSGQGGAATPAPSGAIRKFNPQTGGFN